MNTVKTHAGVILHLCVCCSADTGHFYEPDLKGLVCHDCQTQLRFSQGWLKTAGIKGCAPDKEVSFKEGLT